MKKIKKVSVYVLVFISVFLHSISSCFCFLTYPFKWLLVLLTKNSKLRTLVETNALLDSGYSVVTLLEESLSTERNLFGDQSEDLSEVDKKDQDEDLVDRKTSDEKEG